MRLRGPAVLVALAAGNVALWLAAKPADQPARRFAGEVFGAEAVLLLCCSLVLASLLPGMERWFGGLDRVVVWHRRVAVAGVLLLVGHLALVTSPPDPYATTFGHGLGDLALAGLVFLVVWALAPRLRAARWPGLVRRLGRTSYEHWLGAHRLTGLFVVVAVVHGSIVDPVLRESTVLRVAVSVVGVVGAAAYAYRELVVPRVLPSYYYAVGSVRQLADRVVEIGMDPVRRPLTFTPGQFVVVSFGGFSAWQRHPFSISSSAADRRLEVTVKAAGDYTAGLIDALRPGTPAKVVGPFGGFDYRAGGTEQIWIAGGIGITPFISWIRSLDGDFEQDVDLFYSVRDASDAVYRTEIEAAAGRLGSLRPHFVYSDAAGTLTADRVLTSVPLGQKRWIYMCGPPAMMRDLARAFRKRGVPSSHLRWEEFAGR
jgi:predicted ferric reductase